MSKETDAFEAWEKEILGASAKRIFSFEEARQIWQSGFEAGLDHGAGGGSFAGWIEENPASRFIALGNAGDVKKGILPHVFEYMTNEIRATFNGQEFVFCIAESCNEPRKLHLVVQKTQSGSAYFSLEDIAASSNEPQ